MKKQIDRSAQAQAPQAKPPFASATPLVERHRAGRRAPYGFFTHMGREGLFRYAQEFVRKNDITGNEMLRRMAPGMHCALGREGLLGHFGKGRRWERMDNPTLASYAMQFMSIKRLAKRDDLSVRAPGLYKALLKRRLLDQVVPRQRNWRRWEDMGDRALVEHGQKYRQVTGVDTRGRLQKANRRLHDALKVRGLLDEAGFGMVPIIHWKDMSPDEKLARGTKFMRDNGIETEYGLRKASSGIHAALKRAGLLCRMEFRERRKPRDMDDAELIAHARAEAARLDALSRSGLKQKATATFRELERRGLLYKAGFPRQETRWAGFSDRQAIAHVKSVMEFEGITTKRALLRSHGDLYRLLRRRKLLGRIAFEPLHMSWSGRSDAEVLAMARKAIGKGGMTREEFAKTQNAIYEELCKRGIQRQLGLAYERGMRRPSDAAAPQNSLF